MCSFLLFRDDFGTAFFLALFLGFFLFHFVIFDCLILSMISGEGLGQVRYLYFYEMSGTHFVKISTYFISRMPGGLINTSPENIVRIFPSCSSGVHCTAFLLLFFGRKLSNRKSESVTSCFCSVVGKEEIILNTHVLLVCPIPSVL